MPYSIALERGDENWSELEPNYQRHFEETKAKLAKDGLNVGNFNPRRDQYAKFFREGWLQNYTVRCEGKAVGHANVYITNDMHTGDLIAQEDMIYIVPEHRNGIGRKLALFVLEDLKKRGVTRMLISARTDPRAEKLWHRLGFRRNAVQMIIDFE